MDQEMEGFEIEELLPVVKNLTERYTGKESTSVTYETANMLMEAILYCLRELEEESALPRVERGKANGKLAYEAGYQKVLEKTRQTKLLYEKILVDFDAYGNLAFHETVVKGIPEFFVRYDPRFKPQDHLLTLDYPVLTPMERLRGVDAIWVYLNSVEAETEFLKNIPKDYIQKILSRRYGSYREEFINISVPILQNLLGWRMAETAFKPDLLGKTELERIKDRIVTKEIPELEELLKTCLKALLNYGFPNGEKLFSYFSMHIRDFAVELKHGAEYDCMIL